jgi:hypothetical protein
MLRVQSPLNVAVRMVHDESSALSRFGTCCEASSTTAPQQVLLRVKPTYCKRQLPRARENWMRMAALCSTWQQSSSYTVSVRPYSSSFFDIKADLQRPGPHQQWAHSRVHVELAPRCPIA